MTGLTAICCGDVRGGFSRRLDSVMAAFATSGHHIMIHAYQRTPLLTGVALFTERHSLDVICRHVLAGHAAAG